MRWIASWLVPKAINSIPRALPLAIIFVRVNKWGAFEESDIQLNGLCPYATPVPDFVEGLERKLDSDPGVAPDVYNAFNTFCDAQFVHSYLGSSIVEEGSQEEFTAERPEEPVRLAGRVELTHVTYIATLKWEQYWLGSGMKLKKEVSMNVVFFHGFAVQPGTTTTVLTSTQPWPFPLLLQRDSLRAVSEKYRQYSPRSDLLMLKSKFPRLVVEVNSYPKKAWPEDLIRMLLLGASVVRFANTFLNKFKFKKNFVLLAVYVWEDAEITRYSLFQEPNNGAVYYRTVTFWLKTPVERVKFIRQLYNFRDMLEREEGGNDTESIRLWQQKIYQHAKEHTLKSFYTRNSPGTGNKRRRINRASDSRGEGGGARGAGTTDFAGFRARGYQVEPEAGVIEDGNGGLIKPLFRARPPHILTVYRESDPSKRFIAKKIHMRSNELQIFELLKTFQPKSEQIISLYDSFEIQSTSWVILPKMDSVADYISIQPDLLRGWITQICWDLILGVMYLHKFRIAHRDIKPENLVVDSENNFSLKIIDFDVALQVKDEDEVVEGQCGTKGWMAPEIEEKSVYSPIKADRWSTGHILLYLLNGFREENTVSEDDCE